MYRGIPGKTAGVLTFLEELLPGIDIIPTFTLMWIYTFVFKKGQGEMQVTSTEY
jgi:hypothetical protein